MSCRYYVRWHAAWRELDTRSGRVRGWRRRLRFVFACDGKLQVANTQTVLRGLRALAAGEPGCVRDGPPLPSHRYKEKREPKRYDARCECRHRCCGAARSHGCNKEEIVPVKSTEMVDVSVQVERIQNNVARDRPEHKRRRSPSSSDVTSHENIANETRPKGRERRLKTAEPSSKKATTLLRGSSHEEKTENDKRNRMKDDDAEIQKFVKQLLKKSPAEIECLPTRKLTQRTSTSQESREKYKNVKETRSKVSQSKREGLQTLNTKNEASTKQKPPRRRAQRGSTSDESQNAVDKNSVQTDMESESPEQVGLELTIEESDVFLVRGYLAKHNFLNVDLDSFDDDDDYKRSVFFKLNPLVKVERCERVNLMLRWQRESSQGSVVLKDFATKLGLRCIADDMTKNRENMRPRRSRQSSVRYTEDSDTEEENTPREVLRDRDRNIQTGSKDDSDSAFEKKKLLKRVQSFERSDGEAETRSNREYSLLEDHAIVAWVSAGTRAARVNGNLLWQELCRHYPAITGVARSWHSLRNRYLRHILPTLGSLALSPAQVRRLRAAAARGELKAKKQSRRNSIFKIPRVRSAFSARPWSRKNDGGHSNHSSGEHSNHEDAGSPRGEAGKARGEAGKVGGGRPSLRPSPRQRRLFNPGAVLDAAV